MFQEALNEISFSRFLDQVDSKIWRVSPTSLQSKMTLRVDDYGKKYAHCTHFHRDKLWLILTGDLEDLLTCLAPTSAMSSFPDRSSHRESTPPTRGRGRGGGAPRQRRSTIRHLERVSALPHGCGRTGMPTPPSPAALCRNSIPGG